MIIFSINKLSSTLKIKNKNNNKRFDAIEKLKIYDIIKKDEKENSH